MSSPPIDAADVGVRLKMRGMTKRFPGCLANDSVDLEVAAGEVHALLGENGAGKSTLVKMAYGVLAADSGTIVWEGRPVTIASPAAARRLGIAMVFQHFSLFDAMSVAENIALGLSDPGPMATLKSRIADLSARYGLTLEPERLVGDLTVGERQRVEIVRCLLQEPRLLIMDEPTSVLTPQEVDRLFETLRTLRAEGVSVLYISHKLEEIRALCDRATILRGGRVVDRCIPSERTAGALAAAMIGREVVAASKRAEQARTVHARHEHGPSVLLDIRDLTTSGGASGAVGLDRVNLRVHAGEIVGIAGVAGNGQGVLTAALIGEELSPDPDQIRIGDVPVGRLMPAARRRLLAAFVPEERLGHAAVPPMSLGENVVLTDAGGQQAVVTGATVDYAGAHRRAADIIARFNVSAAGPTAAAQSLSGGNLQKFIIGRELAKGPKVYVAEQPTWGVDAGAAAAIHQMLIDLAEAGAAVLIISQDLDEIFALADRIAALCAGRLSPAIPRAVATPEKVGLMMGGVFDAGDSEPGDEAGRHAAS